MTAQITRSKPRKKKRKSCNGAEKCRKTEKIWSFLWDFGHVFTIFLLTQFDLCGHFEYNQPMFSDKQYFDHPLGSANFQTPRPGGKMKKERKKKTYQLVSYAKPQ